MKTRELTADEIIISVSAEDISEISYSRRTAPLIDRNTEETIETALKIRGSGANLFVCGPSVPERIASVTTVVARLQKDGISGGPASEIIAVKKSAESRKAELLVLPAGEGRRRTLELEKEGIEAAVLKDGAAYPVVFEHYPAAEKLAGWTESENLADWIPGSIIAASGGLLLINAEDVLAETRGWNVLKRVLRTGRISVGEPSRESSRRRDGSGILPEIEVDLKVVLLGNESHYDLLYNNDEDFREQFQFFAELDSSVELNEESLTASVNIFRTAAEDFGKNLTDSAALELIKYSTAAAENISRLSTITSETEMVIREAALNCGGSPDITDKNIIQAIDRQNASFSLLENRIIDDFVTGEINLKVEGFETGKVNGLAVIDKGPWSFGFPGLISARIAPGENGLVNIEHEAGLSGEIHDKWVLILEGFLRSRFAVDFPLSIFASICFEQSYSEIDGDSASSSELYALLSAIADVPLRQDIAVTGSLSQTGEIQAVGGLREKIEGFYKACRAINFTGRQGVIVPERNIKNIVLPDNIIRDIENGRFHIYPVSTVDDSMELLSGMEAGKRNSRNQFPHGCLNSIIEKNLKKLASQAKNFGN